MGLGQQAQIDALGERITAIEEQLAALGQNLKHTIGYYNSHIERHERVAWTDPVTKAMRILCDYVGRHPRPGESDDNFPAQKDWDNDVAEV